MILYSTNCARCRILESALKEHSIPFSVCKDVDHMLKLGLTAAPVLETDDGTRLDFAKAMEFVMGGKFDNTETECEECK